jgi:hypothetical protein
MSPKVIEHSMQFKTPSGMLFNIPDEWWACADMDRFSMNGSQFYHVRSDRKIIQIVPLSEIEPPTRNADVPPFKKYKLIPVLFGFQSPESPLPPVEVLLKVPPDQYRFRVYNGYHRYYASVAVGYVSLPVVVMESPP